MHALQDKNGNIYVFILTLYFTFILFVYSIRSLQFVSRQILYSPLSSHLLLSFLVPEFPISHGHHHHPPVCFIIQRETPEFCIKCTNAPPPIPEPGTE